MKMESKTAEEILESHCPCETFTKAARKRILAAMEQYASSKEAEIESSRKQIDDLKAEVDLRKQFFELSKETHPNCTEAQIAGLWLTFRQEKEIADLVAERDRLVEAFNEVNNQRSQFSNAVEEMRDERDKLVEALHEISDYEEWKVSSTKVIEAIKRIATEALKDYKG